EVQGDDAAGRGQQACGTWHAGHSRRNHAGPSVARSQETTMAAPNPNVEELTDQERRQLEALRDEFERSWQPGQLADRVRALPATGPFRLPALREVVRIDLTRP